MNNQSVVEYRGYFGYNNLGDEAIYLGCNRLFKDKHLIDYPGYNKCDFTLFGGGTIIPHRSYRQYKDSDSPNIGIGLGVRDPEFWNTPTSQLDLRYHLGRYGVDEVLDHNFIEWALDPFLYLFDFVEVSKYYIDEYMFEHLRSFDYLGVRGPLSADILQRFDIQSDIVGDTALFLEPTEYDFEHSKRIGITLRDSGKKFTNDTTYREHLINFLNSMGQDYEILLLPHQPNDIPLHLDLTQSLQNSTFKDYCSYVDVQGILDEYAKCDVIIGEKLHANVLSACTYTPFISLGYQQKNEDFARSIDMSEWNIEIDQLSETWLNDQFERAIQSDNLKMRLEKEVNEKRKLLQTYRDRILADI